MRLVMIDNYDSFTYNLVQLFYEFDLEVLVFRNDEIGIEGIEALEPDWLCISPGPKDPEHAGISKEVVGILGPRVPTLGVCLGMQVINEVFGGRTRKAPVPVHGKTCRVVHWGKGIFAGIPSPFQAARYHSLSIEPHDDSLIPLAFAPDEVIMAIEHRSMPICGVQFHPESFMSEFGLELVENFLSLQPAWHPKDSPCRKADRFPRLAGTACGVPPADVERRTCGTHECVR
jgi:anthranilate synthase component 2